MFACPLICGLSEIQVRAQMSIMLPFTDSIIHFHSYWSPCEVRCPKRLAIRLTLQHSWQFMCPTQYNGEGSSRYLCVVNLGLFIFWCGQSTPLFRLAVVQECGNLKGTQQRNPDRAGPDRTRSNIIVRQLEVKADVGKLENPGWTHAKQAINVHA